MMIDDPEIEQPEPEPTPDPYATASPYFRQLQRLQQPTPMITTEALEEQNPELMAEFIFGPYVENADGTIDCTFRHPLHGDLPFTANADDIEPHGRAAHAYALTQLGKA